MNPISLEASPARRPSGWQVAALATSLLCDLQLLWICSLFYSILTGPSGTIGSRLEGTGGFRDMAWKLGFVSVVTAIVAPRRLAPRWFTRLAKTSGLLAVVLVLLIAAAVHYLRTSLR